MNLKLHLHKKKFAILLVGLTGAPVNIKGKTHEGTGRSGAIEVHVLALLQRGSFNMNNALWQEAAAFAANAHRYQTRNDKRPYVSHCFRVAMTVNLIFGFDDAEVLAGALLHDTIEDCDVDYDEYP